MRRRLWVALLTALLVLTGLVTGPVAPAEADDGDLLVELSGLSPAVLTSGDSLVVSGRITNTSPREIEVPEVRLLMQKHVPADQDALREWLDGTSDLNITTLTGWNPVDLEDPLPAGASVPFRIELALGTDGTFSQLSAWGPRGIEIQARSAGLTASVRTTLLWYPSDPPPDRSADLTLLVPLTATAAEWQRAFDDQLPVGLVAAPRLLAVLAAVGDDAVLAVDPALLETRPPGGVTIEDLDPEPEVDDADPPMHPEQTALIATLATGDHELIALGYADADLTTLAATGGGALWVDGRERGRTLFERAGLTVRDIAWPAQNLSAAAAGVLATDGTEALILDPTGTGSTPVPDASRVVTREGSLPALITDPALGASLLDDRLSGVAARQATLALAAVLARGLPQDPAGFLAVLPRDLGTDPLTALSERLTALRSAPWLRPTSVATLLARTDVAGPGLELPEHLTVEGGLGTDEVSALLRQRDTVAAYAAVAGPTVEDLYTPNLLAPLSSTLNGHSTLRSALTDLGARSVAALGSGIEVESGSDVLLISGEAAMPVTITNHLPVPADVFVELAPEQIWLQAPEAVPTTLQPGESTTERIPITAVANGNATVDVHVLAAVDGADLAPPASFQIQVRAEWETIGTGVIAALLGLAFIIGLIRTIRRGGRRKNAQ